MSFRLLLPFATLPMSPHLSPPLSMSYSPCIVSFHHLTSHCPTSCQTKLNAVFPNRHDDSYAASKDVSHIKRPILRSSTHDDDFIEANDALDDTGPEFSAIRHFLPTTIRYMDLSALPLSALPVCCGFPLLIREEYETMENLLNMGLKGSSGSVSYRAARHRYETRSSI
jgi:hypothetical protein